MFFVFNFYLFIWKNFWWVFSVIKCYCSLSSIYVDLGVVFIGLGGFIVDGVEKCF